MFKQQLSTIFKKEKGESNDIRDLMREMRKTGRCFLFGRGINTETDEGR